MHHLKPVYTPCSWSIDPIESDDTPEARALEKEIGEQLVAAMQGRFENACTANIPRRPSAADYLGEEYDPSLNFDAIRFEMEMLKP